MIPFPDKKYDIIYADPPWSYSDKGCNGNAADHYPTMTVEEICKLPVNVAGGGIASDNCILFMWATYPMLREALKVIEAWGFTYKREFTSCPFYGKEETDGQNDPGDPAPKL